MVHNNWLFEKIKSFTDKPAIIYKDEIFSYLDLHRTVEEFLDYIKQQGIKEGDVVSIIGDYSFKSIALFLALLQNRNIIVPITTKVHHEIDERIRESYTNIKLLIDGSNTETEYVEQKHQPHSLIPSLRAKNHAGLILFSSGSTGKPKAMLQDLDNLIGVFKDRKERNSNILIFLLFDHIGGINTLFNALVSGSSVTIPENRDADYICNLIERHRVNVLPTSPTFLNLILISEAYKKYDLSSLEFITYGTEPMHESLLKKISEVFPNAKLHQTFGTSETGIIKTKSESPSSIYLKIDDPHTEYRVVDGELWLKSKTSIVGYLNASMNNFTEDGWYRTGDVVEESENGYIKIIGRTQEMINVGGLKVLPTEVESVIIEIPQILDCMAYGMKNAITGQIVAVDIVLKEGIDVRIIKKELKKFCGNKLDSYKVPVKINVVDSINFSERFKKMRKK